MTKSGKLSRKADGTFVKGQSGNPKGRPTGSKNRVNLMKVLSEEQFREANTVKIQKVLKLILSKALADDQWAQGKIWDATVSKANLSEDKAGAQSGQHIVIRHMEVKKTGDLIEVESIEDISDE